MRDRIASLRKELNLSQAKFAESVGLSRNFIGLVEGGERSLSDRSIDDICKVHHVNKEWLETGKGTMFVNLTRNQQIYEYANKVVSLSDDNFKKKFLLLLSNLSESDWERFETLFRMLADDSNKTE